MRAVIKVKIHARHTKTQMLRQALGDTRFVWNKLLEKNIERYKKEKKFQFEFEMDREITRMKEEYPFLKQSPSQSLQQIARKLDRSLKLFLIMEFAAKSIKKAASPKKVYVKDELGNWVPLNPNKE